MRKHTRHLLQAAGFMLASTTLSGPLFAASSQQDITDTRQESQIWTSYALSPYLRDSDLNASVHQGQATLTGHVENSVDSDLAKQIALGVNGITNVDNQIIIDRDYVVPAHTGNDFGQRFDDATTSAVIRSKIIWSRFGDSVYASIDTRDGAVTLSGSATDAAAREGAGRIAMNTRGVASVDNQIVIDSQSPTLSKTVRRDAIEAGHEISDGWITAKVKSTFLYSRNVDGYQIAVSTRAGVVMLKGKMDSGAQRALAVELARNVRGVRSVDSSELIL